MMSLNEMRNLLSRGYYSDDEILTPFVQYIEQATKDSREDAIQDLDNILWPELSNAEKEIWLIVFAGLLGF